MGTMSGGGGEKGGKVSRLTWERRARRVTKVESDRERETELSF
jgi:hypothetical protein